MVDVTTPGKEMLQSQTVTQTVSSTQSVEQAAKPAPAATQLEENSKRTPSAGERIFNRVVYTGIGFGVNEASSLWITDQFMHGKNLLAKAPEPLKKIGGWFSKEGFERASEAIAKAFKLTEKIAKDGRKILPKERGGNTLLMATLLSGGTLLILPMKWLENNKTYWVKKADHLADSFSGSKMTEAEVAARDNEVEQAIACSPKQSWPSLLAGRTIAMFSSWASGTFLIGPENNKKIMKGSESLITGAANSVGMTKLAKNDTFKRYAQLIGVETYSCAISSVVLEIASKLLAKRGSQVHDPAICHGKPTESEDSVPKPLDSNSENTDTKLRSTQVRQTSIKSVKESLAPVSYSEKAKLDKELVTGPQAAI